MDWINLVQVRGRLLALPSMVLTLQVVQNAEKFLTPCGGVSFSRALLHGIRYK
jgi:hypothetical protein